VSTPERSADVREQARLQWTNDPAGALAVGEDELGTAESFARIEAYRYAEQPWMHDTFGFERFGGARVLEVGVGLGTDHLQFARAGARMTGIDLTPRSIDLTRRRFTQEGLGTDLRLMDATALEFPDDSFDVVYSFGVLHHTSSLERAVAEIRRVLRPGGVFLGALYSLESAFVARMLAERILRRQWRTETWKERLARVEYSTSGARPEVRLLRKEELRGILRDAGFTSIAIRRRHSGFPRLTRKGPHVLDDVVGRVAGWYLVHEAA
jgi:ubiquinone/menaquinone biosynthesis C-methylase UbiE